ncbi:DUF3203 family protein [Pseudomonas sp. RIT-PI-AD]|uniref:DUF3203 family protein n=1 Tax=Pseudomonas sp. RIT-PI-AD TaxID=3035294 RepID=UPI0021DA0DB8|nr:DUF3203 family protein [Pseudomonas sp. RIT-PI-AD]
MNVEIDAPNDSCTFVVEGNRYPRAISSLVITTDPEKRMSVIDLPETRVFLNEQDAQQLIGAGAKDDRSNVITDDPDN